VAKGTFNADARLKTVTFGRPVKTRCVRFVARTGFGDDRFTSMAEFNVLEDGKLDPEHTDVYAVGPFGSRQ
jgi:hypothetical protein